MGNLSLGSRCPLTSLAKALHGSAAVARAIDPCPGERLRSIVPQSPDHLPYTATQYATGGWLHYWGAGAALHRALSEGIAVYTTMFIVFSQVGKNWPPSLELDATFGVVGVSVVDVFFVVSIARAALGMIGVVIHDLRLIGIPTLVVFYGLNALFLARRGGLEIARAQFKTRTAREKTWLTCAAVATIAGSIASLAFALA